MDALSPEFVVSVRGGVVTGWRAGSGPSVLILHGGPGLSDYTTSLADELVAGFTVYRYQQRGLAPSTTTGPFTVETHMSDAVAVIDAINAGPVFLIGHSWGGHLAMHLAATHPDRLAGLVVVDPLGVVGDGGESDMARLMAQRITPEDAARAAELDERAMQGRGQPGDAIEALSLVWPAYFARPERAPAMPAMGISLACYSGTWDSIHNELGSRDLAPALAGFGSPTAFVLGAQSPIPPLHGVASAALIPGAVTEVLEDCGHFPWLERPGVIRSALLSVQASSSTMTRE